MEASSLHVFLKKPDAAGFEFTKMLEIYRLIVKLDTSELLSFLGFLLPLEPDDVDGNALLRCIFLVVYRLTTARLVRYLNRVRALIAALLRRLPYLRSPDSLCFEIYSQTAIFIQKLCRDGIIATGSEFQAAFKPVMALINASPCSYQINQLRSLLKVQEIPSDICLDNGDFICPRNVLQQLSRMLATEDACMPHACIFLHTSDEHRDVVELIRNMHLLILGMRQNSSFCSDIVCLCYDKTSISIFPGLLKALSSLDDDLIMWYLKAFLSSLDTVPRNLLPDLRIYTSFFEFISYDVVLVTDWISSGQDAILLLFLRFIKRFLASIQENCVDKEAAALLSRAIDFHTKIASLLTKLARSNPKAIPFSIRPLLNKFDQLKNAI